MPDRTAVQFKPRFPAARQVNETLFRRNCAPDIDDSFRIAENLSKDYAVSVEALANLVAALHLAYFLFVVGGFVGILAGARQGWKWIYNPWFRIAHLFAVLMIVAEDVFRFPCALNALEN